MEEQPVPVYLPGVPLQIGDPGRGTAAGSVGVFPASPPDASSFKHSNLMGQWLSQVEAGETADPQDPPPPYCIPHASSGANSQMDTRFSFKHAGHWTNFGSSSSNHDRPHSQRILYRRCAMTEPSSPS